MRETLLAAITEVQRIGDGFTEITEEIDVDKLKIKFMDILEDLSIVQEKKLSNETINLYQELLDEIYHQEDTQVQQIKEVKMEETQEKVGFLVSVFKMWEEKGFAKVELPDEVSLKDMEKAFLKVLEEMPFEDKMKGGYTQEIDKYLLSMTDRVSKRKPRSKSAAEIEADNRYIEGIKDLIDSLHPNYVAEKTVYGEEATKNDIEKIFLESLLTTLSENDFCEVMQDSDFAKNLRSMAIARKLQEINIKSKRGKRGTKAFKKWDGEGEPFRESNLSGKPSVQFFVYNAAKTGKVKFDDLEKKLNKEFGETPKGPRSLKKVIDRINKKISDHQTISIDKDKVVIK